MKLKLFCNSCWVNLVINWACKVRDWKMFLCHFCQVDLQTSQTRNASSFKFEGYLWLFIKNFCCREPKVKEKHIHNYCWWFYHKRSVIVLDFVVFWVSWKKWSGMVQSSNAWIIIALLIILFYGWMLAFIYLLDVNYNYVYCIFLTIKLYLKKIV
jgi:hypothetical protein